MAAQQGQMGPGAPLSLQFSRFFIYHTKAHLLVVGGRGGGSAARFGLLRIARQDGPRLLASEVWVCCSDQWLPHATSRKIMDVTCLYSVLAKAVTSELLDTRAAGPCHVQFARHQ